MTPPTLPQPPTVAAEITLMALHHRLSQIPPGCAFALPMSRALLAEVLRLVEWQHLRIKNLEAVANMAQELTEIDASAEGNAVRVATK